MKLTVLLGSIAAVCVATVLAVQTGSGQAPSEQIRVFGCLQGDGSEGSPWLLAGVVLPPPPGAAPAAAPRGDGGGRGTAPAGGAPPAGGAADAGRGGGGGRGGDGGRGAAPAAAPAPPPPPPVNLRLTGVNMSPWRRMYVEAHGALVGQRPANGAQEFRVAFARSAQGDCR